MLVRQHPNSQGYFFMALIRDIELLIYDDFGLRYCENNGNLIVIDSAGYPIELLDDKTKQRIINDMTEFLKIISK
jgi:hypothetical protein